LLGAVWGRFVDGIFIAGYGQGLGCLRVKQHRLYAGGAEVKAEKKGHSCSKTAKLFRRSWPTDRHR
jgi:hypothetical protein